MIMNDLSHLTYELNAATSKAKNEEELRFAWVRLLSDFFHINFSMEELHNDAYYAGIIFEFKDVGLFKGRITSRAFKEAIHDRLYKYITSRSKHESVTDEEYIGVATDGKHLAFAYVKNRQIHHGQLLPVCDSSIVLLAQAIKGKWRKPVTPEQLIRDFGHNSDIGVGLMQSLSDALVTALSSAQPNKIKMLFEEWQALYGQVADVSSSLVSDITQHIKFQINQQILKEKYIPAILFVIHTYDSLFMKLLAAEIVAHVGGKTAYIGFAEHALSLSLKQLGSVLEEDVEKGKYYSRAGINGFVEEAIFSWYLDTSSPEYEAILTTIQSLLIKLATYRTYDLNIARSRDVLKHLYQNLVPDTLRKSLGEFYTPDWLVDITLDSTGILEWHKQRCLDPTCGSGSFLLAIIERVRKNAIANNWTPKKTLNYIMANVWGFDLNPLAVQATRVNLLIAISDLIEQCKAIDIELPVLLADAVYSPAHDPDDPGGVVSYSIGSNISNLTVTLPAELAFDRKKLDKIFSIMGEHIEHGNEYENAEADLLISGSLTSLEEAKQWHAPLSNTYNRVLALHRKSWNGIWFRIVRNFFWSSTAGEFDLVVGNPPWVRWSKLPNLYRERIKSTCLKYDIFSSTPFHGGNELDISAMITYTVADKWLKKDGTLAFLITQSVFQAPSSEGFRRFRINSQYNLIPQFVEDLKQLRPFPSAANKTALIIAKKQAHSKIVYPVPYTLWKPLPGTSTQIPVSYSKDQVLQQVQKIEMEANPVGGMGSPWSVLPSGHFSRIKKIAGESHWVQGRKGITVDLNGAYFVKALDVSDNGYILIENRPEAGKTDIGPKQQFWVESDMLYPLLKGASDFSSCYINIEHELLTFVPNKGITKQYYDESDARLLADLPKTLEYFVTFKKLLEQRSTYKGRMPSAPFYAVYNIGEYTFAPWKVIWAEQKNFCAAVCSSRMLDSVGSKTLIPDHKVFFAAFDEPEPAQYLCGLLNTAIVKEFIESHVIKIQIGNIFKHLNLPKFDIAQSAHRKLATLVKLAHETDNTSKRSLILNDISYLGTTIIFDQ